MIYNNKQKTNLPQLRITLVLILITTLTACTATQDRTTELSAVEALLDRFRQAFAAKDMALLAELFAHDEDMVNIGTDADEVWIGWEPWEKSFTKQFTAYDKIMIAFNNVSIKLHSSGKIAWFSAFMEVDIVSHEQPFHYDGMRVTGVAEKRDGGWVFVQRHVSLPYPEQAVQY